MQDLTDMLFIYPHIPKYMDTPDYTIDLTINSIGMPKENRLSHGLLGELRA